MKWTQINLACWQTDTHAVCEVPTGAKSVEYVAYDRLKTGGFKEFASYDTGKDAKIRCENEAKAMKRKRR